MAEPITGALARREPWTEPPMGMLAELTHRCPLQCPYCSNPLELERASGELATAEWCRVLEEAAELGVLQLHLSGGEPTARADLEEIVARARGLGLYTNLITAGVLLDERRIAALREAGLEHVQLSFQAAEAGTADRVGGYRGGHLKKLAVARAVRAAGLPLTLNAVVHRQNLDQLEAMVGLALDLGAHRLEVAHVQYYGWALKNRAALMPTREQLEAATAVVERSRRELRGRLAIDYVIPDYWAKRPKPCMGGWGSNVLNVTPQGRVMPCHAAGSIPGLEFASVRERPLRWIWQESPAFQRFRGTDWLPEPCRSCALKEIDFGGCRCQALALTGDATATDPACELSPLHEALFAVARAESAAEPPPFVYRRPQREAPAQAPVRLQVPEPA
ncbi:MAG TPA: pyrroloquinoline quinone biosynthesis protein PqqE [Geminicoccaceae bacterium]|nr:pyrroloquinoline quinone biosynthesis protein PqqE [Geminicoccaceae bacterium]